MTRANKALTVLFVASLGLWGCTQGPTNGPSALERIRALETKNARLEEDYKSAATSRDLLQKKLAQTEAQRNQKAEELELVQKERDMLRGQYEQFRSSIRELLGRAEATLNPPPPPVPPITTTNAAAAPGES